MGFLLLFVFSLPLIAAETPVGSGKTEKDTGKHKPVRRIRDSEPSRKDTATSHPAESSFVESRRDAGSEQKSQRDQRNQDTQHDQQNAGDQYLGKPLDVDDFIKKVRSGEIRIKPPAEPTAVPNLADYGL